MYTKKELVDLITIGLGGGAVPDNRKYHPVVVAKYIDAAMNSIIAEEFKKDVLQGMNIIDSSWIRVFENLRVKWDQIRGQCYITWPSQVLYLQNLKGIREIGWQFQDGSPTFRIMESSSFQVLSNLESSELEIGVYFALIESNKVYFPDMPQNVVTMKRKLMAKAVASFSAYDNDEDVAIPDERIKDVIAIIQQLMQGYRATRAKVSNDSNPNTI